MGPKSVIDEDEARFLRVQLLLIEVGRTVLMKILNVRTYASGNIEGWLRTCEGQLKNLKKCKIISLAQWSLLLPKPKVSEWDIGLVVILLKNLCGIPGPMCGWTPSEQDVSLAADLMRMRQFRNKFQGHSAHAKIDELTYEEIQMSLSKILLRLANEVSETFMKTIETKISDNLTMSLDPQCHRELKAQIQRWEDMDICNTLVSLQQEFQNVSRVMDQNGEKLLKELEEFLLNVFKNIQTREIFCSENTKRFIVEHVSQLLGKIWVQLSEFEKGVRQSVHTEIKSSISEILESYSKMTTHVAQSFERQQNNNQTIMSRLDRNHKEIMESKSFLKEQTKLLKRVEKYLSCCTKSSGGVSDDEFTQIGHTKPVDIDTKQAFLSHNCTQTEAGLLQHSVQTQTESDDTDKVVMSCGHKYDIYTLDHHLKSTVSDGETEFRCTDCKRVWNIDEVRDLLDWGDRENRKYEEDLNKNYMKKHESDIKCCPGCTMYSERCDTRSNYVVCSNRTCRLRYCWMCLQKWKSFCGNKTCGNSDCQTYIAMKSERNRKLLKPNRTINDVKAAKNTLNLLASRQLNTDRYRSCAIID